MKLLHYLIPTIFAACGNASSDEQPSGCQMDSDCKTESICLERICREGSHLEDTGIKDVDESDATPQTSQKQGLIFTLTQVQGINQLVRYDLGTNTFSYIKDQQENILIIPNLVLADFSASGKMLAYVTQKDESFELTAYNLVTGNSKIVAQGMDFPTISFGGDDELFYTRFGNRQDGTRESAIYKINLHNMANQVKVLSFPLQGWTIKFAVEPSEKRIVFNCVPQENIERAMEEVDPSIYSPMVLCLTDYNTIHPEEYRYYEHDQKGPFHLADWDFTWDRFYKGNHEYDALLKVLMICQDEEGLTGVCGAVHPNNIGVVPYFLNEGDGIYTIVPNEDHSQILLGDVIYDRTITTQGNPLLYKIPWGREGDLEGKTVKIPGHIVGFRTE